MGWDFARDARLQIEGPGATDAVPVVINGGPCIKGYWRQQAALGPDGMGRAAKIEECSVAVHRDAAPDLKRDLPVRVAGDDYVLREYLPQDDGIMVELIVVKIP